MTAAIYFAPDAYVLEGNQIMGRRAAGAAFLRAVVEGRDGGPVTAYTLGQQSVELFEKIVRGIDPAAPTSWIQLGRHDQVAALGTLHRADTAIGAEARMRLRAGPARFSLTGITHTLSTSSPLARIGAYLTEPVMPWDALICTSSVARDVVRATLEQTADYLSWRLGAPAMPPPPQLPVIPLGIHSADWAPSDATRHAARARLSIGDDEVAVLFAGRLAYASKAHPFQMFEALRTVADRGDRPIRLLLAGQFFNETIARNFLADQRTYCPNVRCQHVDGADADLYAAAFGGADIFLSLADNHQETFGITPIEAMAAALPVVVSDWNGYRDTVREGVDGFRIPSWAPGPDAGENIAHGYEIVGNYDIYSSRTSTTVSVDMAQLVDRLAALVADPALRRSMGAAGRERVVAEYDWSVIYPRYRALWQELESIRTHESATAVTAEWLKRAPRAHPAHDDPFRRFASYPSHMITLDTPVRAAPGASRAAYDALTGRLMFGFWKLEAGLAERVIVAAQAGPRPLSDIAREAGLDARLAIEQIARLAKMNLLILGDDAI
ncbi:glycosyltransferase family 4 protein [Sphingomonadaceae bacterium G21617-S1]|nr:glycosyltransferase family 4 protein [Sphingomonadaceae bacterium G21617-S1]